MKTEKVIYDGKEIELVTELPSEYKEYILKEEDLEDTIDLEGIKKVVSEEDNG